MNQTVQRPDGSSQTTKTFELGGAATARTATSPSECRIYNFDDYQAHPPALPKGRSISALVERWEKDPERKRGVRAARRELARTLHPGDELTLRALRLRAGWSQTDLARRLETSQSHIARLERGTTEPMLSTCRRLADMFGIDLNTLAAAVQARSGKTG